ncbi:hypothetical protein [Fuerstiella marisgermanici]|uniref:Uncharacterized protein n=1 Tax=Fuerstiella marisgermanici TaxID=1891926 RepID=A0A1P8WMQ6_9PLAN|nr:hypothetical protein [Fuerstiella marisgermanici]APZ95346.1 hypothetical protein Fuma_05002 [Fuerstiella marisgermanici]
MSHSQSSAAFAPQPNSSTLQSGEVFLIAFRSHQPADWLSNAERSLSEFLKLPLDWNSYGGKPADQHSIDAARALVKLLAEVVSVRQPDVGLTPDGLATLSWELEAKREVEVEVEPTGTMSINHFNDASDLHQSFRTRDFGQLAELLTRWSQEG